MFIVTSYFPLKAAGSAKEGREEEERGRKGKTMAEGVKGRRKGRRYKRGKKNVRVEEDEDERELVVEARRHCLYLSISIIMSKIRQDDEEEEE